MRHKNVFWLTLAVVLVGLWLVLVAPHYPPPF